MQMLEGKVKEAFIEIYFSDSNYVKLLHQDLIKQIKSVVDENAIYTKEDGNEYIMIEGTAKSKATEVHHEYQVHLQIALKLTCLYGA